MPIRVAIACGGTGGHLFPGLAVAEALRRRGHEALLLVSQKAIDRTALAGRGDLPSRSLPAIGWPGLRSARLPAFFVKLVQTRSACRQFFREYRPSAVLGMGGFTSAVPLWTARRTGIPTLLHESNAVPGRVTRLFRNRVDRVLLGFSDCAAHLSPARCAVTGTPVRDNLRVLSRKEAAAALGLDPDRRTVAIIGGSQGAQGLNRIVCETLPRWADRGQNWQFIHLTGEAEQAAVAEVYRKEDALSAVHAFSDKMAEIYSLADLVIGRSGASSLTELSHYGLPSILIPFPAAAADHQTANAHIYARVGAAKLYKQAELKPETLDAAVRALLDEEPRRQEMARAAASLAVPDAADRVAREVEACVGD